MEAKDETKYKVGDKVKIISRLTKSRNSYESTFFSKMDKYLGTIMTIANCDKVYLTESEKIIDVYYMKEDINDSESIYGWIWTNDMIEGLAKIISANKLLNVDGQYVIYW